MPFATPENQGEEPRLRSSTKLSSSSTMPRADARSSTAPVVNRRFYLNVLINCASSTLCLCLCLCPIRCLPLSLCLPLYRSSLAKASIHTCPSMLKKAAEVPAINTLKRGALAFHRRHSCNDLRRHLRA